MMERIESVEDGLRGVVTYQLADGRRVCFDVRMVHELGLEECCRAAGLADQVPTGRLPVIQDGIMVGTLPAAFDPLCIRSRTMMYDPRSGDFRLENGTWIASRSLGPSDLTAVEGFRPA